MLCRHLRKLTNPRFREQVPFGPYVLDFYAPRYRLCIEIDGAFHDRDRDSIRDAWLLQRGVFTVRFNAEQLDPEKIVASIEYACEWLKPRYRLKKDQ